MDPVTISMLAMAAGQAIPALFQGGLGAQQGLRARKMRKNAVRPTAEVPMGFQEAVGVSRNAFYDPNMPGQQYFQDQIAGTQAAGTRGAYQMGGSAAERMMGAALASSGASTGMAELGAKAAQMQQQDAQNYMNMLSQLGQYQRQNWEYNKAQPYAELMAAAQKEADSSNRNIYGALKGIGGAAVSAAGGIGKMTESANANKGSGALMGLGGAAFPSGSRTGAGTGGMFGGGSGSVGATAGLTGGRVGNPLTTPATGSDVVTNNNATAGQVDPFMQGSLPSLNPQQPLQMVPDAQGKVVSPFPVQQGTPYEMPVDNTQMAFGGQLQNPQLLNSDFNTSEANKFVKNGFPNMDAIKFYPQQSATPQDMLNPFEDQQVVQNPGLYQDETAYRMGQLNAPQPFNEAGPGMMPQGFTQASPYFAAGGKGTFESLIPNYQDIAIDEMLKEMQKPVAKNTNPDKLLMDLTASISSFTPSRVKYK